MLKIGNLTLEQPTVLAPMAGLTDRALRQLMDEIGGCGLLVSEMIAAEGLRRRNRRTLEMIADFTDPHAAVHPAFRRQSRGAGRGRGHRLRPKRRSPAST